MSTTKGKIPNPLTAFRILSLPVLWVFALLGWQPALAIGLALAALSDAFDGRLAKRYPQFTNGKFDSLADKLLTFSVIGWLVLLKPFLFTTYPWPLLLATIIYSISLFIGWRKHGRVTTLHTHLGKLGGLVQALFVFHAFLTSGFIASSYSPVLFYLAIGLFILAATEELLIQLVYPEIDDEVIRSIIPYLRERLKPQ
jgi:phosphatidylglycerophosphate synthase